MPHPFTLIRTPESLSNASEAERLHAANAVITKLRRQRAQARQLPLAVVPTNAPPPKPPCTRVAGLPTDPVQRAAFSAEFSNNDDQPSGDLDLQAGTTVGFIRPSLQFAAVASVGVLSGVLLTVLLQSEPRSTTPSGVLDIQRQVDIISNMAKLEAQNDELANTVITLELETTRLQNELLRLELETLRAPIDEDQVDDLTPSVPIVDKQGPSETLRSSIVSTADEAQNVLESTNYGALTKEQIASAFARSQEALDEIERRRIDSSASFAELDNARRLVNDKLVAAIGIDNMAAKRHALGEPNLLSIADVVDPNSMVLEGDILVSVDGHRVIDNEQLRWLENDAADAADDAGESSETHILEVLRDGQPMSLVFDAPIGQLLVEEKSMRPPVVP